jgi:hypothetical protein
LFDVLNDDRPIRVWWCAECAIDARRQRRTFEPAPAWIERAALRKLPVKEIPDPARSSGVPTTKTPWIGVERRRGERRRTPRVALNPQSAS